MTTLTNATIGDSVTSLNDYLFYGCTGLVGVTLGSNIESIGDYTFYNCTKLNEITIPNNVTAIGDYAFWDCENLVRVTFGNNLKTIGDNTFYNCTKLTKLIIPNSVTTIGDHTFYYCERLATLILEDGMKTLTLASTDAPFRSCPLETLYLGRNLDLSYNNNSSPFNGMKLANVTIGDSVTSLNEYLFYGCTDLVGVTLGKNIETIGNNAFYNCTKLSDITVPNSVTAIGKYAFYGCIGLITLEDSIESIGDYAFYGCTGLIRITFSNNIESIGDYTFYGCTKLAEITIPNSVTAIGDHAFYNCEGLTTLILEDGVETLTLTANTTDTPPYTFTGCPLETLYLGRNLSYNSSHSLFHGMKMLTNVVIGNNVTTIGPNAFRICTSLTEITIPENITTIDNYAFYGCEYLVEINSMNPTPPTIKSNTFGNVDKNMCVLNVPIGSKEAYAQADYWSEFYNINEVDFAEESDGIEKILTNLDEEAVIHCEERNLVIQGKNLPVVVYDLTGRLVRQKTVQQEKRIELPNGYYIVKAGSTTQKIWVGG